MKEKMSQVEAYKKIIRQFFKGVPGSVSQADFDRYAADPDFLEALDAYMEETSGSDLEEPDTEALFSKIKADQRLKGGLQNIPRRSIRLRRIVVAASVLLIALGSGIVAYKWYADALLSDSLIAQAPVLPGSQKAQIILENGERIDLENIKGDTIIDNGAFEIVKSTDGFISYRMKAGQIETSRLVYNTILTPKGGEYRLLLPDGTKVWLNAMTKLKYPVHFTSRIREVELEGEAFFEVAKQTHQGKRVPFIIHSADQKLEVLGTVFNLQNYGNTIVTTLVEGSVKLSYNQADLGDHYLTPEDQMTFSASKQELKKIKVDPFYYCAWKDGNFAFDKTSIQEVMGIISRWYDVDVIFDSPLKDFRFSGTISRYEDINKLLQTIELVGGIHFQLKGRKIYVTD